DRVHSTVSVVLIPRYADLAGHVTPGKEVRCARRPRIFVSHVEASHELDEHRASGTPRVGSRPVPVRKRAVLHPTTWLEFVLFGRQAARNPVAAHLTQGLADDPH